MPYINSISYSEIINGRDECVRRFGSILECPIADSVNQECRRFYQSGSVLDFGCGVDKPLKGVLGLSDDVYYSLDSDPAGEFNFRSFTDIPSSVNFNYVFFNQVLEHLTLDDAVEILKSAIKVLAPAGKLFISVPNASHPVRYHADVTHVTNWPHQDLYGVLRHLGCEIENVLRTNKRRFPRNPLKAWLIKTVCRELRIDWCDTMILEACKP